MNKLVVDTNVLLQNPDILEKYSCYEIVIPLVVVQELDRQKREGHADLAYRARTAIKFLKDNDFVFDVDFAKTSGKDNDDVIVDCAIKNEGTLITGDFNMQIKAKAQGLTVLEFDEKKDLFKGYRIVEIDTTEDDGAEWIQKFYDSPDINSLNMLPNEYLIIRDTSIPIYKTEDGEEEFLGYKTLDIRRWNGEKFVGLKSPSFPKGKGVKALNDLQKCAIDLLNLPQSEVPVKVVLGTYGSGKSFLGTKIAVHKIGTEEYSQLILIREPTNESSVEIGYLAGSISDKMGFVYDSVIQHLDGGEFEAEMLEKSGKLRKLYLGHSKGISIKDAVIICDECEDLSLKGIKLVGSRLEKSSVIFLGDINQVNKKIYNSGIAEFVSKTKNNPMVGVVVLDLDVRSEESKLFANL